MAKNLEKRIEMIEARNQRVEQDKAWEISLTRRLTISILIYATVAVYLFAIKADQPLLNAVIPGGGYLLSTMLVPQIRAIWQRRR